EERIGSDGSRLMNKRNRRGDASAMNEKVINFLQEVSSKLTPSVNAINNKIYLMLGAFEAEHAAALMQLHQIVRQVRDENNCPLAGMDTANNLNFNSLDDLRAFMRFLDARFPGAGLEARFERMWTATDSLVDVVKVELIESSATDSDFGIDEEVDDDK